MSHAVKTLQDLVAARYLRRGDVPSAAPHRRWGRDALSGRLVEIRAANASARLTAAFGLVVDAQRGGDTAVWITTVHSCFFPPDAEESGADLDTLAVVRLANAGDIPAAADKLIRSGAFGLVVMDLTPGPSPAERRRGGTQAGHIGARLAGLARKHDAAVIALTGDDASSASLGPLVSMKGEARRTSSPASASAPPQPPPGGGRQWGVEIRIVRDKQGAAGWSHVEQCLGPAGLR
jgi:recombination protein RecA